MLLLLLLHVAQESLHDLLRARSSGSLSMLLLLQDPPAVILIRQSFRMAD